jgi:hypothetical protein
MNTNHLIDPGFVRGNELDPKGIFLSDFVNKNGFEALPQTHFYKFLFKED